MQCFLYIPFEAVIALLTFYFQRGGTFLEAGAFDGEIHSNTIYLERFLVGVILPRTGHMEKAALKLTTPLKMGRNIPLFADG